MKWKIFRNRQKADRELTAVARKLILRGQFDAAIDKYDQLLARDGNNIRALLKKADLLQRTGEGLYAAELYMRLARLYSGMGFHLKAVSMLKQVVRLDEDRVEAHLMLADEYEKLELTREAVCSLGRVAVYYDKRGMHSEMREMLRRIFELGKQFVRDPVKLGDLYARAGMHQEAQEHYQQLADDLKGTDQAEEYLEVMDRLVAYGKLDPDSAGERTIN